MGAVFVDGFDSASGEGKGDGFFEFWDVNALLLEIWVLSNHPGGVEFGSTSPVGVTSTHDRTLI